MGLSDFSLWGTLAVLALTGTAFGLLWLCDQRLLHILSGWRLLPHRPLTLAPRFSLIALLAVVVGSLAVTGCLMLCLPHRLFWPVLVVTGACLLLSVPRAVNTYVWTMRHTEDHRRYLVACSATHLESVMPCVRRALRSALLIVLFRQRSPIVLALLLFFCGILIGGATLWAALLIVLLVWLSVLAASVLASVLALFLTDKVR
jgi:ABC-type iron transport system FetAB permease component